MTETQTPPTTRINTGTEVSMVGFGCFNPGNPPGIIPGIEAATKIGYTLYDTAALYENEKEVGDVLRASGIPREKLFVTTKLFNDCHDNVEASFDRSLEALNLDYIDMFLMHWPQATVPGQKYVADDSISFVDTWKRLEKLLETRAGKVKAIGVSNFSVKTLTELLKHAKVVPAMNQVETHPYNQDRELVKLCQEKGIVVEAYTPLGFADSPFFKDQDLLSIAKEIGDDVTVPNVVLSWNVQRGVIVLPKTCTPDRAKENFRILRLSDAHMQRIYDIENDPKRRHQRLCQAYDPKTKTALGWTYDQLGWNKPIQMMEN